MAEGTFGGVSDLLADLAPSLLVAAEIYSIWPRFGPTFSDTMLLSGNGRTRSLTESGLWAPGIPARPCPLPCNRVRSHAAWENGLRVRNEPVCSPACPASSWRRSSGAGRPPTRPRRVGQDGGANSLYGLANSRTRGKRDAPRASGDPPAARRAGPRGSQLCSPSLPAGPRGRDPGYGWPTAR